MYGEIMVTKMPLGNRNSLALQCSLPTGTSLPQCVAQPVSPHCKGEWDVLEPIAMLSQRGERRDTDLRAPPRLGDFCYIVLIILAPTIVARECGKPALH
jgi:hypothetical protein